MFKRYQFLAVFFALGALTGCITRTPWQQAISEGDIAKVDALIASGAGTRRQALCGAGGYRNKDMAEYYSRSASPSDATEGYMCAASSENNRVMIDFFLSHGADPAATTPEGLSAFDLAVDIAHDPEQARYLASRGAHRTEAGRKFAAELAALLLRRPSCPFLQQQGPEPGLRETPRPVNVRRGSNGWTARNSALREVLLETAVFARARV